LTGVKWALRRGILNQPEKTINLRRVFD